MRCWSLLWSWCVPHDKIVSVSITEDCITPITFFFILFSSYLHGSLWSPLFAHLCSKIHSDGVLWGVNLLFFNHSCHKRLPSVVHFNNTRCCNEWRAIECIIIVVLGYLNLSRWNSWSYQVSVHIWLLKPFCIVHQLNPCCTMSESIDRLLRLILSTSRCWSMTGKKALQ